MEYVVISSENILGRPLLVLDASMGQATDVHERNSGTVSSEFHHGAWGFHNRRVTTGADLDLLMAALPSKGYSR
jgi:hypothetical protein